MDTKSLLEEISKHRKRAEEYREMAKESEKLATESERTAVAWESILSQIQTLQKQDGQTGGKVIQITEAKPNRLRHTKFDFAREVIQQHREEGILPADIRRLACERGIACPTSYPYGLLSRMLKKGKLRRDDFTGRYYPIDSLFSGKTIEGTIAIKEG